MSTPEGLIGNRYRLITRIGSGGMGVVWEAWDERLERRVAVKVLHRQPGLSDADLQLANDRAMREARISARLHHRYAVPVFDVVDHHGQPCLVMQFVQSMPLSAVLRESGPLQPSEAAQVGAQSASALAAAHRAGIVHRDVKPGNILITDDGSAMISDFGISHALGDVTLTQTGLVHGTPAYLAPEVARGGESSPASDVFSLGATLYSAMEGAPPFGSDPNSIALLHRVAGGSFNPPRRSGTLAPLLVEMLASQPEDRPAMSEVAQRLADLRSGQPPAPAEPGLEPEPTAVLPVAAEQEPTRVRTPPVVPAGADIDTPLAPAPVASTWSVPPSKAPADERPAKNRTALILGIALVAAVVIIALMVWRLPDDPGATAPPATPSTAASPTASTTPSPSATPTPTPSASSPSASTPTPTPTPTPSGSPSSTTGTPTAAELAQAITDYYALMPGGTDQAWPRMTTSYQTVTTGGRASYERFWGAIRSVSTSDVRGTPPRTAQATVTYTYKDGRVSKERTTFQLVRDDGILKINSSRVN